MNQFGGLVTMYVDHLPYRDKLEFTPATLEAFERDEFFHYCCGRQQTYFEQWGRMNTRLRAAHVAISLVRDYVYDAFEKAWRKSHYAEPITEEVIREWLQHLEEPETEVPFFLEEALHPVCHGAADLMVSGEWSRMLETYRN